MGEVGDEHGPVLGLDLGQSVRSAIRETPCNGVRENAQDFPDGNADFLRLVRALLLVRFQRSEGEFAETLKQGRKVELRAS